MSKYLLSNSVSVSIPGRGPVQLQPGKLIDSSQYPIALLQAAGAKLVLQADANPADAELATERKLKGKSLPLDQAELQEAFTDATDLNIPGATSGDLLYFNGVNWTRLGIGSTGNTLGVSSGNPAWGALNLAGGAAYVSGALPLGNLAGVASAYQQLVWNGSAWTGIGILSATLTNKDSVVDCGTSSAGTDGNANQFVLPAATLTANHTLTLNTDSAVVGETITMVRLDATAHTYAVINGGAGAGTMITLPASAKRVASFSFDGVNWNLASVASFS